MKPINVLVVSSKYVPERAGSGLRAHNTYKRLSEKYPVTFEVLTGSLVFNNSKIYEADGRRVTRIARKLFSLADEDRRVYVPLSFSEKIKHGLNYFCEAVLTWIYLRFNAGRFDLIHIFGKNWVTSATVTFAKRYKKPFIVELSNLTTVPHQYEPRLFRWMLGEAFPEDTPIVCISDYLKKMCEKEGYKRNVWCRPNPIDMAKFFIDRGNKAKFRRKYTPFGDDDILLVCVSKFRPSKKQIFLLDVLKKLPEKFKLVLAGPLDESGPFAERDRNYLRAIKDKISEYRLESRVQLEPRFIDKVDEYLKMSDVFLFPTENEALGSIMLEAIACGLPVVANRIAGVTDCWIEDGKDGFLSGLNAEEFAEKVKRAREIDAEVFKQKREEVVSQCSADVIDKAYFDLIKKTAKIK